VRSPTQSTARLAGYPSRSVARVRHAVLTAATGSKQCAAGHSTSTRVSGGGESAWESTDDRPWGGFTSRASALG